MEMKKTGGLVVVGTGMTGPRHMTVEARAQGLEARVTLLPARVHTGVQ
jgi:hypothetical protein